MTKYEFLGDLSRLLSDLPEEERKQAMKYYEDYFADAGESQEQNVLQELGSPEDIAEQIKADSSEHIEYGEGSSSHMRDFAHPSRSSSQNTQNGWQTGNTDNTQSDQTGQSQTEGNGWQTENTGNTQSDQAWQSQAGQSQKEPASDSGNTALIIIIAVITSPIWASILAGIVSLIAGIFSAIIGIFAGLIFGGGGVAIGGFACVFGGIIACVTGEVASGLLTVGIGCVLFCAGSVCCYLGIMLCIKLVPALWHECVRGFDWGKKKLQQTFHF